MLTDYVEHVQQRLSMDYPTALNVTALVLEEVNRFGAASARPVFEAGGDGTGPYCSWCWMVAGLCTHLGPGRHPEETR